MSNENTQYPDIEIPSAFLNHVDKLHKTSQQYTIDMDAAIILHRERIGREAFATVFNKEFGFGSPDTLRRRARFLTKKNVHMRNLHKFHKTIKNRLTPSKDSEV